MTEKVWAKLKRVPEFLNYILKYKFKPPYALAIDGFSSSTIAITVAYKIEKMVNRG